MKYSFNSQRKLTLATLSCLLILNACSETKKIQTGTQEKPKEDSPTTILPEVRFSELANYKKISFLLTNDIHGHLEPTKNKAGAPLGGMAYLATVVDSIRNQPEYKSGEAAFFVLDSGDQFQGTLLSNFNEGQAVFEAMNAIGYDAIVPGNHDYDFGPLGWLYDKVTIGKTSTNPREVIEGLANIAKFPLLSANTYLKKSIHAQGSSAEVALDSQCKLKNQSSLDALDFENASSPSFLQPYSIISKANIKVALIGLDNHATASTTTFENVEDLCFRDEIETYLELRKKLEGKADVFVILMHNGNSDNSKEGSNIAAEINKRYTNGVHLVAAGHTHAIHNANVDGVRVIQDGAENKFFGRVDLYLDKNTGQVETAMTNSREGIAIDHNECKVVNGNFCNEYSLPLTPRADVQKIVDEATKAVAPISNELLGSAKEIINRDRISESALGNILTDSFRAAAQTQISFMNTGGIRTEIKAGPVYYRDVFEVLPFSNMGVVMNEVSWPVIKSILSKAIQTCGRYGILVQSGLKIKFARTCTAASDLDLKAKLLHVELLDGTVLLDTETGIEAKETAIFSVATLDFLAAGGSGYEEFKNAKISKVLGIVRELIVSALRISQPTLSNTIDGRMTNVTVTSATTKAENEKGQYLDLGTSL